MSFLNILFLVGAVGIAGPILAHLLARPRFKRIPFTMMQFLEAGEMESQRRRRFRNILILLLRCAIILCIVLGFAGPVFEEKVAATEDQATVIVGVDDSLSLAYENRFEESRNAIEQRLAALPADARITIVGLASGQRLQEADVPTAVAFLKQLEPVPATAVLSNLLNSLPPSGEHAGNLSVYLASDFTPHMLGQISGHGEPATVSNYEALFPTDPTPPTNGRIISVRPSAPTAEVLQLAVVLEHQGAEVAHLEIQAHIGDSETVVAPVTLHPGRRGSVTLRLPNEDTSGESIPVTVSVRTNDGLAADNHHYLGVAFPERSETYVLILCTNRREAFLVQTALDALGNSLPHFQFTTQVMPYGLLDPSSLQVADTVIVTAADPALERVSDALETFVKDGGQLITFLGREQDESTLKTLYTRGLLPAHPLELKENAITLTAAVAPTRSSKASGALRALQNYDLGGYVFDAWYACEMAPDSEAQWFLESGDALLYRRESGAGETILLNTSADDSLSGLSKSPAVLPLYSYLLGTEGTLLVASFDADAPIRFTCAPSSASENRSVIITTPAGQRRDGEFAQGSLRAPPLNELGIATSTTPGAPVYLGLNVPPGETDLTPATEAQIQGAMARLFRKASAETAQEGNHTTARTHFSAWALAAALGLLLLETFVANRMVR